MRRTRRAIASTASANITTAHERELVVLVDVPAAERAQDLAEQPAPDEALRVVEGHVRRRPEVRHAQALEQRDREDARDDDQDVERRPRGHRRRARAGRRIGWRTRRHGRNRPARWQKFRRRRGSPERASRRFSYHLNGNPRKGSQTLLHDGLRRGTRLRPRVLMGTLGRVPEPSHDGLRRGTRLRPRVTGLEGFPNLPRWSRRGEPGSSTRSQPRFLTRQAW